MRGRLRRPARRRREPRDDRARGDGARQPGAPRRGGGGRRHRRRSGDDPAAAGRALPRRDRGAPAARTLRRRHVLPPPRRGSGRGARAPACGDRRGRGPARGGLARRSGGSGAGRPDRRRGGAARPAALRRGRPRPRSRRLRAEALRDPPRGRARRRPGPRDPELLGPDRGLQGHAHRPAADRLLPGPAGRTHRLGARARALPLLDEHVPELGARASLPDDRAQRRDQHAAGQRQLDAGARVAAGVGALRRRPRPDPAGRPSRWVGLGDLRQRARAARARGPLAAARDHDDDPRGLPGPRRRLAGARGLLRVPPVPDGGLGRPGGDCLHGRARDRRDARPQRPASGALARDGRRVGRARIGDGRPRGGARERRSEGAAPAREALPRRPRAAAGSSRTRS